MILDLDTVDWEKIANTVCGTLVMIARDPAAYLRDFPGATPEQVAAMAITQLIRTDLEGLAHGEPVPNRTPSPERPKRRPRKRRGE